MQAVFKIHLMSLESIFRLQSFVKTKDAFKIVHQQSTEADQNEQKYQQLLLRLEISLLKNSLFEERDARTHGRTDARTHDIASPWAPVGAKKNLPQEKSKHLYYFLELLKSVKNGQAMG